MSSVRATHLERLEFSNFRRFETLKVDFDPRLTVLVANNGGGKTAVIDGAAIALNLFIETLTEVAGHGFHKDDMRWTRSEAGAMVQQAPTSLKARGRVDGHSTEWLRELATANGKTTRVNAKQLAARATALLTHLREHAGGRRSDPPLLPVIARYGTGRLWSTHRVTKKKAQRATSQAIPTAAYLDCLSTSSSYGQFEVWFENVVREAQNERESGINSPHKPQALLAGVRAAVDQVLKPSEWSHLDWDFLRGEVVANHPAQGRLPVSFLSDGIQNLLALVADLAHRAVRLNPHLGEAAPARSPGIVLIDEVDMHLHPSWQQTVIGGLQAAFPEVQFIVTTHSHLVVSTVPSACVRIIQDDGTATHPVLEVQGSESALALSEAFGVASEAPIPIVRDLSRYRRFIEEGHDTSDEAMTLRRRLDAHFGANHPVMLSVESLRRIVELRSRVARRAAPA